VWGQLAPATLFNSCTGPPGLRVMRPVFIVLERLCPWPRAFQDNAFRHNSCPALISNGGWTCTCFTWSSQLLWVSAWQAAAKHFKARRATLDRQVQRATPALKAHPVRQGRQGWLDRQGHQPFGPSEQIATRPVALRSAMMTRFCSSLIAVRRGTRPFFLMSDPRHVACVMRRTTRLSLSAQRHPRKPRRAVGQAGTGLEVAISARGES
jgi:hypothetical protein